MSGKLNLFQQQHTSAPCLTRFCRSGLPAQVLILDVHAIEIVNEPLSCLRVECQIHHADAARLQIPILYGSTGDWATQMIFATQHGEIGQADFVQITRCDSRVSWFMAAVSPYAVAVAVQKDEDDIMKDFLGTDTYLDSLH